MSQINVNPTREPVEVVDTSGDRSASQPNAPAPAGNTSGSTGNTSGSGGSTTNNPPSNP
jgi:hypothetical protein